MINDTLSFMKSATADQIGLAEHRKGIRGVKDHLTATVKRIFSRPEFVVYGSGTQFKSWRFRRQASKTINALVGWTPFKKVTFVTGEHEFEGQSLAGKRVILYTNPVTAALEVIWWRAAEGVNRCLNQQCLSYCYIPYHRGNRSKRHANSDLSGINGGVTGVIEQGAYFSPSIAKKNSEYRNYFKLVGEKLLYGPEGRNKEV